MRWPGRLRETRGFPSPPRDGFGVSKHSDLKPALSLIKESQQAFRLFDTENLLQFLQNALYHKCYDKNLKPDDCESPGFMGPTGTMPHSGTKES